MDGAGKLSGRTRFTAIFGDPVEHSLSPAMHNAAYAALGLDRAYVAFHVAPAHLRIAIHGVAALGLLGVNLTVPHKERALHMMAHLSDEARTLRAINCVVNRDGVLYGDNTDARGLESDLRDSGLQLEGRHAVIVGAGGAAAAAVLAAIRLGAGRITICNRTVARANRLARRFATYLASRGGGRANELIEGRGLETLSRSGTLSDAALFVNATPVGLQSGLMPPIDYAATPAHCLFYDLVYARELTSFLKPAADLGRRVMDGAGMLADQGALAFELFNQIAPPPGLMRATLMTALGRA
jgi:shikimate dehydrogenase